MKGKRERAAYESKERELDRERRLREERVREKTIGEELAIIGGRRKKRKENKVTRNSYFSLLRWSIIQAARYRCFV